MKSELTGRKVFAITASAFAVIIGVNIVMAVQAIRSFPGLEVKNSYVASQSFDAERTAQEALGWSLAHDYRDGILRLDFRDAGGVPVRVENLSAIIGRTTASADDLAPVFAWDGKGYAAEADLEPGKWMVLMEAYSDTGTRFHQRIDLFVAG